MTHDFRLIRPPVAFWRAAFIAATLIAFSVAVWPRPVTFEGDNVDKGLHFGTFYVLEVLALVSYRRLRITPAIGLVLLGGAIELIQGQIGRDCSVWDWLADTLGVMAAMAPVAAAKLRWEDRRPGETL
jgi:VanZ family protein